MSPRGWRGQLNHLPPGLCWCRPPHIMSPLQCQPGCAQAGMSPQSAMASDMLDTSSCGVPFQVAGASPKHLAA